MTYKIVSLYDMLEQNIGKEKIMNILSDFLCPLNPNVESFIHDKAYDFERIGLARTYLVYYQVGNKNAKFVAIFVLGQSHIEINEKMANNMKKKMFGTTYPLGKNVKTLLIGQLAKNFGHKNNQYITGEILMGFAFSAIKNIHKRFPSVVTHIDCKDDYHLRNYYEKLGFSLFKKTEDRLVYLFPTNKIRDEVIKLENKHNI